MKVATAAAAVLLVWCHSASGDGASAQLLCNGHAELCSRPYNSISFACTHNSYSYPPPTESLALNQQRSIQEQLDDGVRAFMLDVVRPSAAESIWNRLINWTRQVFSPPNASLDSVHLCHQSCSLVDKGRFVDTLKVFAEFLDKHPSEVVTFIIENVSGFSAKDLQPSFAQAGLEKYAFTPKPVFAAHAANHSGYQWPTLGQMVSENQRLVVFVDSGEQADVVPYILSEWEYVVEIPYANINPVKEFPCNQDRPRDGQPRDLLVLNHFAYNRLTIAGKNIDMPLHPSQIKEHQYNSVASLQMHLGTCAKTWGASRVFNFITLDYYDIGNSSVFQIVNKINGVK
ncbi:hypothetical protein H4R26_001635 [Coemansia thaxteri]|uniref:PLC-like phosphodiesterase n=1 Tax=Coemansia thaxteri TaxID=2663907 RepID=A0A9W8EKZ1_9FUNG|nr:hypothetical protein H4R26_001635 [Coemansia thaxteri]